MKALRGFGLLVVLTSHITLAARLPTSFFHGSRESDRPVPTMGCAAAVAFGDSSVASGADPSSVSVADLDGDGDPDVVLASEENDEITWRENTDGAGTFGPERAVAPLAVNPLSVSAADLDGDGDNDVVAGGDWIRWFENTDGSGSFEIHHDIDTNVHDTLSLDAVDLDGDGDIDLLSASAGSDDAVRWYENLDGAGTFILRQTLATNAFDASSVDAADLDGDGDPDVVCASKGGVGRFGWFENTDGNGTFGQEQYIAFVAGARSVVIADMDMDGDNDVLSAAQYDDTVAWYENTNGQGSFSQARTIANDALDVYSVAAGDLDGDGDADVLSARLANGPGPYLVWYENLDGSGNFGPLSAVDDIGASFRSVLAEDIDGDGDADAVAILGSAVRWYDNGLDDCNKNGVNDGCEAAGVAAACTDVDRDGASAADDCNDGNPRCSSDCTDLDLDGFCVTSDCDDSTPFCAEDCTLCAEDCDSDGIPDSFATAVHFAATALSGPRGQAVAAKDLDGDGDVDVLASIEDDTLVWYENTDGRGAFGFQQFVGAAGPAIEAVAAEDLDGDGDRDALYVDSQADDVAWFANDGAGGFGAKRIISSHDESVRSVVAGDVDGDGDNDVVAGGWAVTWYENVSGDGSLWQPHVVGDPATSGRPAFVCDLDGDGDLDLLTALGNTLVWYENLDGQGGFGTQNVIDSYAVAAALSAADLDGDGDLDVIAGSGLFERTAWYENLDGQGSFGPGAPVSQSIRYPWAVFAADLDNDGDQDLLTAATYDRLVWQENLDGDGNFGPHNAVPAESNYTRAVVAADLDGDGDLDVLSATDSNLGNQGIAWHENLRDNCNDNALPDACEDPEVAAVCTDVDQDGFSAVGDCDDTATQVWSEPGPVSGLELASVGLPRTTVLTWPEATQPGAAIVRYDTLRSPVASDFQGAAVCLDVDAEDRTTADFQTPPPGEIRHYLIRVENDCPGSGNLGADSAGLPRVGLTCP